MPAGLDLRLRESVDAAAGQPVEGPVYLRSSNHTLPDLVLAMHGLIDVDVVGRIDSVDGGIRSNFETIPDQPVSKFVLTLKGGGKGILVNSTTYVIRTPRPKC